ncbi:hypothetical protein OJAV_G00082900 [Oryzias javanicus]|uniref:Uncharacterized protein n=1 Tax=Oryzias javanicus TaxID=123683 RepID=A0A437D5N2_ORYJA|nr:hypothetical protein OJAV_G00082900 [Oryzias javanicus]
MFTKRNVQEAERTRWKRLPGFRPESVLEEKGTVLELRQVPAVVDGRVPRNAASQINPAMKTQSCRASF